MRTIENIRNNPAYPRPTALTIGNFDGCHLGHQDLIRAVAVRASENQLIAAILTFDPPPEQFFGGNERTSERLFTTSQKLRALAELGVELAVVEPFDKQLAKMTHEDFFSQLLVSALKVKQLVIGYDFHFGKNRRGNADYLQSACRQHDIGILRGDSIKYCDETISSTRVRQAVVRGAIADATAMLGRPYLLEGSVVKGEQNGRRIGFPTANLGNCKQLLPRKGVYAGYTCFENDRHIMCQPSTALPVVINIGSRPTFASNTELRVEAHSYSTHFAEDELYNKPMGLYFHHRLRDEQKFDGIEELKAAIAADIEAAKQALLRR